LLILGLPLSQQIVSAQSEATDPDLQAGIRHVREGDFDQALVTLDSVVRRLSTQKGQARELARAYTYLAIAYVGLAQQEAAKAKFLEAWRADKSMTLSPKEFPPNIIEFFEQAKKEAQEKDAANGKSTASPPTTPTPAPPSAASADTPKKGGGHTGLILLGVGGLAAAGIAIAAGSKGGSGTTSTDYSRFYGTYSLVAYTAQVSGCSTNFTATLVVSGSSTGSNFQIVKTAPAGQFTFMGTIDSAGNFNVSGQGYSLHGQTTGSQISGTESQNGTSCSWAFSGSR